ncbi:MAG TPA: alpha-L-arabinofuranosidase C-terminal domain-containing protein [Terriglobia bacterium]|nr:alpha-L-arabinofuranosidase C-terminal domain-containing protein [Terriglobia bacterium]
MSLPMSRRQFAANSAALSLSAMAPKGLFGETDSAQKVVIRGDVEIGQVRPEFHGQFAEHLGSCVYGGLWVGKNSPIPNINGYRKQAVEYLRELGIPVLRWPGGCFADDYHWRDGIGPAAARPKRVNIHWGGYVEDNSFGTHEFIGLCKLIGAEPYFAGNVGSGSPSELRHWIEYCNYPSGSTLADERAANGSAEPFGIRHWGVGNESWGCGGAMRPEEYADLFRRFSVYIREFGGVKPFKVACGPGGDNAQWSRGVLYGLQKHLPEGLSMHYYQNGKDPATNFTVEHMDEQLAEFAKLEQAIIQQRALLDGYQGGDKVELIVDEWGVWDRIPREDEKKYGRLWQQSTQRSAVGAGLGLNIFNRLADKLTMCNIAQIVNVLQSLLLTDGPEGRNCVRTSTYYTFALFKPHRSKTAVRVEAGGTSPLGLSVSASKSDRELVVSLVNPHHDDDMQVDCTLHGFKARGAAAQILHDPDLNAYNGFDHPDRLVPKSHPVALEGSSVKMDLPRLSVATVTLQGSAVG